MMYAAHIAWSLGLILVALGFVALHFAGKENSGHFRIAGWLLVVGGTLGLIGNGYYSLKHLQRGTFETRMMMRQSSMTPMGGAMMHGKMPGESPQTNPTSPPPQ